MTRPPVLRALLVASGLAALWAGPSAGFAIRNVNPDTTGRWSPLLGNVVEITVDVAPGFAYAIGADDAAEAALIDQAVADAFAAWESPSLQFDVDFDAPVNPGSNLDIDLYSLPPSDPFWGGSPTFATSDVRTLLVTDRLLTNGQVLPGYGDRIVGADIIINEGAVAAIEILLADDAERLDALTRLIMHQIGHTIGLAHPEDASARWDTDGDPSNPIPIDPLDPFGGLTLANFPVPTDAIMVAFPCGAELVNCPPLFLNELTNDDRGGRDALYPVLVASEPGLLTPLAGGAALALAAGRCRRVGRE